MATKRSLFTGLAALLLGALAVAQDARPFALMIGDPAPPLSVSKWVKGTPVKQFERGKVYVVEFWATWCGPCKVSIPHLSDLQKKVGDKATFIGVSIWESDQANVEPFVKEMGDKMAYTVAMDQQKNATEKVGDMARSWMEASGQNGIPASFIIDREGRIAWIGHPMEMDEPLNKVLEGSWDTKAFLESKRSEMESAAKITALNKRFKAALAAKEYTGALAIADEMIAGGLEPLGYSAKYRVYAREQKDYAAALKLVDGMIADEKMRGMGASLKFDLLLNQQKDFDAAFTHGRLMVSEYFKDSSPMLNQLAWTLVDPEKPLEKTDLDLALKAAERSVELERGWANVDTLARVWFLKGDKAKAIALQKEAISLAPEGEKTGLEKTLKQYEQS